MFYFTHIRNMCGNPFHWRRGLYKNGWWFQYQDRSIHSILAMALGKRFVSWPYEKKPRRSTCTMINESGKAKKVRNLCCKGCKIQEKWPFLGTFFSWSEGHETLKGLSFLSACWCAYTRDSAPGGMYMYMYIQLFATGVGKCSFLGIFSITFKCSLEIVFPIVGWC